MEIYNVIGLMSGTSLDGLDIAYCQFSYNGQWRFKILKTKHVVYEDKQKNELKEAVKLSAIDLLALHHSYGQWLGEQVKQFIDDEQLIVDFIASHGHTVHHQPQRGISCQIGCGQYLSNISGLPVVNDFRSGDLALGGQGAPLVPIGDRYLFEEYDFCLNLGGISNISFEDNGLRIAYDIGIGNMLLNYLSQKIGKPYDKNGEIARHGTVNNVIFEQLNSLEYYKLTYPKSTGYEWFQAKIRPVIDSSDDSIENLLCTSVHHIAYSICQEVTSYSKNTDNQRLLVTGGGALNTFLIETMRDYMNKSVRIVIPERAIIDYKEALIFGFLGVLRKRHEINILRSVTGATDDSCGGVFYFPNKK